MTIFIPAWINGTLAPVEKLEVHKRGLKHKAISIFVFCAGKLLIQQRASDKYHSPELWANSCCSHPNWGESSEDCSSSSIRPVLAGLPRTEKLPAHGKCVGREDSNQAHAQIR